MLVSGVQKNDCLYMYILFLRFISHKIKKFFFDVGPYFKAFVDFVTTLLLTYVLVFGHEAGAILAP